MFDILYVYNGILAISLEALFKRASERHDNDSVPITSGTVTDINRKGQRYVGISSYYMNVT